MEHNGQYAGRMNTSGIDGLRGIGAIAIAFFSHYFYMVPERNFPFYNGLTYWCWNYARFFVEMFFLISGFVITMSYHDRILQKKVSFWNYFKKRVLRFYPLMLVTLVLTAMVQAVHMQLTGDYFAKEIVMENTVVSFLLHLLCLQGTGLAPVSFNSPAWYLSILLIMYVIFYVLTALFAKYRLEYVAYFLMVVLGVFFSVTGYAAIFLNCRGLMGFFAGCLLYGLCELYQRIPKEWCRIILQVVVAASWIVIVCLGAVKGHIVFGPERQLIVVYALLIWPPVVFLTIVNPVVRNVMSNKVFAWFGTLSFSMYMIHFSILTLLDDVLKLVHIPLGFESKKVFLIYLVMMMAASVICYEVVEKRWSKWIYQKFGK